MVRNIGRIFEFKSLYAVPSFLFESPSCVIKTLYNYDAINITLGLPFVRISPDHGVGENITGKKIANSKSLIESIKFFNYLK